MDIKTAVSEAITNSIEHGYENKISEDNIVKINAYIYEEDNDIIKIEVKDNGIGIEDIELALTPVNVVVILPFLILCFTLTIIYAPLNIGILFNWKYIIGII